MTDDQADKLVERAVSALECLAEGIVKLAETQATLIVALANATVEEEERALGLGEDPRARR
jgi:hypothetical protein